MKATVAAYSATARHGLGVARFPSPYGPLWGNGGDFVAYNSSAYGRGDGTTQFVLFANTEPVHRALNRIYLAAHRGTRGTR
jgi:hypothetical protein